MALYKFTVLFLEILGFVMHRCVWQRDFRASKRTHCEKVIKIQATGM